MTVAPKYLDQSPIFCGTLWDPLAPCETPWDPSGTPFSCGFNFSLHLFPWFRPVHPCSAQLPNKRDVIASSLGARAFLSSSSSSLRFPRYTCKVNTTGGVPLNHSQVGAYAEGKEISAERGVGWAPLLLPPPPRRRPPPLQRRRRKRKVHVCSKR